MRVVSSVYLFLLVIFSFPILAKEEWNVSITPKHIYRLVELRYLDYPDQMELALYALRPFSNNLLPLETAEECAEESRTALTAFRDDTQEFDDAKRIWSDWNRGVLGLESEHDIHFIRLICVPRDMVDDIDLFTHPELIERASDYSYYRHDIFLILPEFLPEKDSRSRFRYDVDTFFDRFEKYGVTRTLKYPDTVLRARQVDGEIWNVDLFLFPILQRNYR